VTFDPDDALLAGYHRFRRDLWPAQAERYERLAERGQRPSTAVIACSDARIDPQAIFDAEQGELFVIRNVAGLVPPYAPDRFYHGTSAALEFAVKILRVRTLVLLGHADCDGVHAMVHGPLRQAPDFLMQWMDIAEPVMWPMVDSVPGESLEERIADAVTGLSLTNLRSFPWISSAEKSGSLRLRAFKLDLGQGMLEELSTER